MKIKTTGIYKTRDGRKVYICFIKDNMAYGCIDGYVRKTFDTWILNGRSLKTIDEDSPADIVKKKYFDFKGKDND